MAIKRLARIMRTFLRLRKRHRMSQPAGRLPAPLARAAPKLRSVGIIGVTGVSLRTAVYFLLISQWLSVTAFRWDHHTTTPAHHTSIPPHQHTTKPAYHHSSTPPLQHITTPAYYHSSTPHQHTTTAARHHTSIPPHHHTSTPPHQHTTTAAHRHSSTPSHQHVTTPAHHHTSKPPHHHTSTPDPTSHRPSSDKQQTICRKKLPYRTLTAEAWLQQIQFGTSVAAAPDGSRSYTELGNTYIRNCLL